MQTARHTEAGTSLCEKAYTFVSRLLMRGELAPGAKLSERTLSLACGVSRVPMREAIRRLVEEGVLYQKSQSGTYVSALTREELIEIYEVREAIECRQIRAALPKMSEKDRRDFAAHANAQRRIAEAFRASGKSLLEGKEEQDFLHHDFAQHLLLLKRAGNRYAEKIISAAYRRNRFFGLHSHRRNLDHVAWTWRYHKRMADAVLANDADRAEFWMRQHIIRSLKDALRMFDAQRTGGVQPPLSRAALRTLD